jgi:hypothetical protein
MATKAQVSSERTPRGIPKAPFVVSLLYTRPDSTNNDTIRQADVEEYLGGPEGEVEGTLKGFQEAIAYVFLNLSVYCHS